VATTGILGKIARIAAVAIGVALLLVTCVVSIPVLLLAWPAHAIRKRMGRPLTWIGSLITTVVVAAVLMGALIAFGMLQRTPAGVTGWHEVITASQPTQEAPLPHWLRYFPGATAGYHPHSTRFYATGAVFGFAMFAEFLGAVIGSFVWGAAWLVVSGWTGRIAFVPE
jgi:hypothetical protein